MYQKCTIWPLNGKCVYIEVLKTASKIASKYISLKSMWKAGMDGSIGNTLVTHTTLHL